VAMQVIMVSQLGGPEVLQAGEADLPQPRPGEVLVRVLAAGVGPWDASLRPAAGPARCPTSPAGVRRGGRGRHRR
jgi:NADPH:quinone reductase and related Zn-dependent oxidoreductases